MTPRAPAYSYTTLRDRADIMLRVFEAAGFEPISLDIIQPAGLFLDTMGESVRSSTYVFDDHYGNELCLRPDLTVPTCRHYLDTQPSPSGRKRYAYYGPVFRFRPDRVGLGQPDEIRQTGIESIGETDRAGADADVLRLTLDALRAAGLKRIDVAIGDVGIFSALLGGIAMPDRWRKQLQHLFFQPAAFQRYFDHLHAPRDESPSHLPAPLQAAMGAAMRTKSADAAEAALIAYLAESGIPHIGNRTPAEIAAHVLEQIEDSELEPLPSLHARLIDAYVREPDVKPPDTARDRIRDLAKLYGVDIGAALDVYSERLRMLAKAGIDLSEIEFSTSVGRNFEYYTGFVFEVSVMSAGSRVVVASGGRYDGLIKVVDGTRDAPAVGAAIYLDRLLTAVKG